MGSDSVFVSKKCCMYFWCIQYTSSIIIYMFGWPLEAKKQADIVSDTIDTLHFSPFYNLRKKICNGPTCLYHDGDCSRDWSFTEGIFAVLGYGILGLCLLAVFGIFGASYQIDRRRKTYEISNDR
jgi:hypothetical protein